MKQKSYVLIFIRTIHNITTFMINLVGLRQIGGVLLWKGVAKINSSRECSKPPVDAPGLIVNLIPVFKILSNTNDKHLLVILELSNPTRDTPRNILDGLRIVSASPLIPGDEVENCKERMGRAGVIDRFAFR